MSKAQELKKEQVAEIKNRLENAKSFIVVDYKGLTVAEDTELRNEFRKNGVTYSVLKNRLVARALHEMGINDFDEALNGPSAFAISDNDVVAPAKIFAQKQKQFKKMAVKCGWADGQFCDQKAVEKLATMPSREQLIAMLMGMLNAPITSFARAINAIAEKNA